MKMTTVRFHLFDFVPLCILLPPPFVAPSYSAVTAPVLLHNYVRHHVLNFLAA